MTTNGPAQTPWSVSYHDGSGNGFRFQRELAGERARFEYTPVTPAQSSSGTYSGGAPNSGDLDSEQVHELWRRVLELESETALHAAQRQMLTGAFRVQTPAGERTFLVTRSAPLEAFDAFVEPLRGA
jgi:hypothetical protein